ncbi:MAG: hypothetical protein HUU21_07745 [Polyangiaceae bacterium]|nr:hypothetical protein [Polyangiaceae bacterium]NUQ73432.1 hypothetical protein [Polyangiaceae bacterium]
MFIATMSYELHPTTSSDARKLLRAELVGRRWNDRYDSAPLPSNTVWIKRTAGPGENTNHLHAACSSELLAAAAAVARRGLPIRVVRAWIHVSGAGTFGAALLPREPEAT